MLKWLYSQIGGPQMQSLDNSVVPRFPVDDDLSEGKLRFLLDQRSERAELDCKQSFDMSDKGNAAELTKDCLAIAHTRGGYLLFGVTKQLAPEGLSQEQYDEFDGSKLIAKIQSYCPSQEIRLILAKHDIELNGESKRLVLVFIPKSHQLLIPVKDGVYRDQQGKEQVAFRTGDLLVRHDDRSERMQPQDFLRFLSEAIEREKERWMEDMTRLIAESEKDKLGYQVADQEFTPPTLMVDSAAFWRILVSLHRNHDTAGFLDLIDLATQLIDSKWHEGQSLSLEEARELIASQLDIVLDKLTLITISAIRFNDNIVFQEAISSLGRLYSLGWTGDILRGPSQPPAVLLWHWPPNAVMLRIYAIGGYTIFKQQYDKIQPILELDVVTAPTGARQEALLIAHPEYWRYSTEQPTFFERAEEYLQARAGLLRLMQEQKRDILSWLCQFDLLAGYIRWQQQEWLGFFCFRDARLSTSAIELTLHKPDEILGPHYDAQSFADYLRTAQATAQRGGNRWTWRTETLPPDVQELLDEYPPEKP